MNKIASILLVVLCLGIFISAKAQSHTAVRSFGPGFCDSIREISKEYYESQQTKLSIIDTMGILPKKGNRFYVKFGKDSLIFGDKSYETDSGFMLYNAIVGIDKNRGWVLVLSEDEISPTYYLIDQKNQKIDTLAGYPYLIDDKLIFMEAIHTDGGHRIEVRQIKRGQTSLIFQDFFGRCKDSPDNFSISKRNELMYKTYDDKYWIVNGPLF